jgi:transposase
MTPGPKTLVTCYTKSGKIVCMTQTPRITLAAHLSSAALYDQYRQCRDKKESRRWHALWLFSTGRPISEVASLVGLHRNWVRTVIKRYNADGPAGVIDRHAQQPGGRPACLTPVHEQALREALEQPPAEGGAWSGPKVATWIARTTGRAHVPPQLGWVYLRKLDYTRQLPRPQHSQRATLEEQEAWKKN